jgi:hypothetical protein
MGWLMGNPKKDSKVDYIVISDASVTKKQNLGRPCRPPNPHSFEQ